MGHGGMTAQHHNGGILAFSGSNNTLSINAPLLTLALAAVTLPATRIDLGDYALPLMSLDIERESGQPEAALRLQEVFDAHAGFLIVTPEHNGGMPVFLKNAIDWLSRKERKVFGGKPALILSASPGPRAGTDVRAATEFIVNRLGGNVVGTAGFGPWATLYDATTNDLHHDDDRMRLKDAIDRLQAAII